MKKSWSIRAAAAALTLALAVPVYAGNSEPADVGSFYLNQEPPAGVYMTTDSNCIYSYGRGYFGTVGVINIVSGTYAVVTISGPTGSQQFSGPSTATFTGSSGNNTVIFTETFSANGTAIASGTVGNTR